MNEETNRFHCTYDAPDACLGNAELLHKSLSVNFWLISNRRKDSTGIISEIVSICPHKHLKVSIYTYTFRVFSFT